MSKVVGIGASVLDTCIVMDIYPEEDKKKKAENIFQTGGGPVGNALVAISKLGEKSMFLGALSNDSNGRFLRDEFTRYGVDSSHAKLIDNTSAFTSYIVLAKESGTRTCVFDRGSVPDSVQNVDLSEIKQGDILHLDGNYIKSAIGAAKYAKSVGAIVSLDGGGLYDGVKELLPLVDVLIASEEFALKLSGSDNADEAIRDIYTTYSPKTLVITQGSKGGIYYENGEIKKYASYKVNCVDSNGAGDTFHGAFLVAYMNGLSLEDCCKFASATSAIKCTRTGVRDSLPGKKEVEKFLKERE